MNYSSSNTDIQAFVAIISHQLNPINDLKLKTADLKWYRLFTRSFSRPYINEKEAVWQRETTTNGAAKSGQWSGTLTCHGFPQFYGGSRTGEPG